MANSNYPEAPKYDQRDRFYQLDQRGARMGMYAQLPNGRCWDQAHLELVKDINETWAPFTVMRKILIEAGARNVGAAMLMTEREQQQWYDYIDALEGKKGDEALRQAKEHGSGIKPYTIREL
jgi:hypothetical protein